MLANDCPGCRRPVSIFARVCRGCGAPNPARIAGLLVGAALLFLLLAVATTVVMILRWQKSGILAVQSSPAEPSAVESSAYGDFGWLRAAMDDCDAQAARSPSELHFLVVPLAAARADLEQWRAKSINDIGNGILVSSQMAFDGLTGGTLRISPRNYVFRVRDETANATFQWKRSLGVAKLSNPDAESINFFRIQFSAGDQSGADQWGSSFTRQKGACYWVNAIIGN
jgi:hypothetical protein